MNRERIQAPPPPQTELEAIIDEAVASFYDSVIALGNLANQAHPNKQRRVTRLVMAANMAFVNVLDHAQDALDEEHKNASLHRVEFAMQMQAPNPKPSPAFLLRVAARLPGEDVAP